jgi:hypothetical protein
VTVKQLATWAGLDVRTVHYWLAGENGGPSSRHVSLWLARLPAAVRVHVAIAQLAGSGLTVVTAPEADVDVRDLMGKALEVSGAAQELAEKTNETTADGILTTDERTALLASAVHVRRAGRSSHRGNRTTAANARRLKEPPCPRKP